MPFIQTHLQPQIPVSLQTALDEAIIQHVDLHEVIKDTDLTIVMMAEFSGKVSADPFCEAGAIAKSIHRLINSGRLGGIDCDAPSGSFTLVLPKSTRAMIALPIYVTENQTRH